MADTVTKAHVETPPSEPTKERKSMNTYVILFFVTAFIAVLTWFIPGGEYSLDEAGHALSGTYQQVASNPQGLWDVCIAGILGMVGTETTAAAIPISLTVMFFGSFLEMMETTGAIKAALGGITKKASGSTHALIFALVAVMAFFGTLEGCYEEGIVYYMMFVPVILMLGLDTVTAVLIVIMGSQVGCLASTVNPFSVGIASGIADVSTGDGMGLRAVLLVVLVILASLMICRYADKVQKNPESSSQYYRREQDLVEFTGEGIAESEGLTSKQRTALIWFFILFGVMILGFIPWTSINPSWTFFEDGVAALANVPVLGTLLGRDITPFGLWYFNELSLLIIVVTVIIGLSQGYDINKTVDIIMKGASGLVSTALVVAMARGIQVVMDAGKITPTILHLGETTLSALPPVAFVLISLVFYFLISLLIPSSSGLAAATMGVMASLSRFAGVDPSLMVTIMCMGLGMAKMFTPTSIIVMTCTSAAHIDYPTWLKIILPKVAVIFAVNVVFLIVGVML
jgi:uncharacterized ion transporter superfamily protein YfcC